MTGPNDRRRREEIDTARTDGGYEYDAEEDERLSRAVIDSVSNVRGVEPTELPPLYDTIDPDGLDGLFGSRVQEGGTEPRIEFTYAGCDVMVYASGRVVVEEPD